MNIQYRAIGHAAAIALTTCMVMKFYLSSFSSVKNCSSLRHEFDTVLLGRPILECEAHLHLVPRLKLDEALSLLCHCDS